VSAQIVHFECGCRISVGATGEVGNWQQCEAGHLGMPTVAQWFWHAAKDKLASVQHSLEEREFCEDERCQLVARKLSRAKGHPWATHRPKVDFGSEEGG
jgi:hypothetical protein